MTDSVLGVENGVENTDDQRWHGYTMDDSTNAPSTVRSIRTDVEAWMAAQLGTCREGAACPI